MGFFSDLKEDLSQAVNELLPEEQQQTVKESKEEAIDMQDMNLSDMLDKLDELNAFEEEDGLLSSKEDVLEDIDSVSVSGSLQALLDSIDISAAEEPVAQTFVTPEPVVQPAMEPEVATSETEPEAAPAFEPEVTPDFAPVVEPVAEETPVFAPVVEPVAEPEAAPAFEPVMTPVAEPEPEVAPVIAPMAEPEMAPDFTQTEEVNIENNIPGETEATTMDGRTQMQGQFVEFEMKQPSNETAVITAGMTIRGDIEAEGSIEVIGKVIGNLEILGKMSVSGTIEGNATAAEVYADHAHIIGEIRSEGSIKVGQNSVIMGNLFGNSAVVAGAVKGDLDINGPVVIDSTAIVLGNIVSRSVQINNGAVIQGMCSQSYAEVNPTTFFDELGNK